MFSIPSFLGELGRDTAVLCACVALAACAPSDFGKRKGKQTDSACGADASLEAGACEGEPGDDDEWMPDDEADDADAETDADVESDADAGEPIIPVDPLAEAGTLPDATEPHGCVGCRGDSGLEADASVTPPDAGIEPIPPACAGGARICVPNQRYDEAQPCGDCGSGMRVRSRTCNADGCGYGAFGAWGACMGMETECAPGETQQEKRGCGICNLGSQTRTRACSTQTCEWADWGAWSTCSQVSPTCMPGQTETQTQSCGACGTGSQSRTRTCSNACAWGAWSAYGACGGVTAACSPGQTAGCSPGDSCGHRVCSNSCTWGGCVPRVANGCLRRRGGTQEEGSNYRCCGDGRWQFCLPDCHWSADCAACSPTNCEC